MTMMPEQHAGNDFPANPGGHCLFVAYFNASLWENNIWRFMMMICVGASRQVRLVDPLDFRRFSVRIESPGLQFHDAQQALGGIAELESRETAWVDERALREWPGLAVDGNTWQSGLDAMIAYAKGRGWVDDARQSIRAHVEWAEGSGATESEAARTRPGV